MAVFVPGVKEAVREKAEREAASALSLQRSMLVFPSGFSERRPRR